MIRESSLSGTVRRVLFVLFTLAFSSVHACAQSPPPATDSRLLAGFERERQWLNLTEPLDEASQEPQAGAAIQQTKHQWSYGGFADLGYLLDFNHPLNHLFRNRGTTARVDEFDLNMAAVYVTKDASDKSRWGMELEAQAGETPKVSGSPPRRLISPGPIGCDRSARRMFPISRPWERDSPCRVESSAA
jgi:hypothetical protein